MSKIDFITTDAKEILTTILTELENGVSEPLYPGDERRIFAEAALAPLFVSLFNAVNDACKQKMLRYARGEVLDALGENWKCFRQLPIKATTEVRFFIKEPLTQNIIIPVGVQVTSDKIRYFATDMTVVLQAGQTYVDVSATATEGGTAHNDISIGEITTIVDRSECPLIDGVTNTIASKGGADKESDDSYRQRIREADSTHSTAGPSQAYRYWAIAADPSQIADAVVQIPVEHLQLTLDVFNSNEQKAAFLGGIAMKESSLYVFQHGSETPAVKNTDYRLVYDPETEILKIEILPEGSLSSSEQIDVTIDKEKAGTVQIIPIKYGGEIPDETLLQKVLESCTQDDVKPLTDKVEVSAPEVFSYDIELTYYTTAADEERCIETIEGAGGAIDRYVYWQGSSLNRDINPDYLRKLILSADWDGAVPATRVIVNSPAYQDLPINTLAKWSGNKTITHVVKEGVN